MCGAEASAMLRRHSPQISTLKQKAKATSSMNDSSVLKDLKETIQKQANEIQALQQQLVSQQQQARKSATTHSGGHGVSSASADELQSYLNQPFYRIAMKRVGWLSLFLVSLSMTAVIMNGFEHTLSRQLELAYFVPLLAGHGGNTGGQSVGTVLSALSSGTIRRQDAPRVILKEALSGIMGGTLLGIAVGILANRVMGISLPVSAVVCCTLPLVSTIAATLGSSIPFLCLSLGLDPSVIAAPAMTSFVDVSGLMSYFLIANWIFSLFGLEL